MDQRINQNEKKKKKKKNKNKVEVQIVGCHIWNLWVGFVNHLPQRWYFVLNVDVGCALKTRR